MKNGWRLDVNFGKFAFAMRKLIHNFFDFIRTAEATENLVKFGIKSEHVGKS